MAHDAHTATVDPFIGDLRPLRNPGGRPAKNYAARSNRKLECPACGFACRTTAAQIRRAGGLPVCACGQRLEIPELRDRAAIEPEQVEAELEQMSDTAQRAVCRELGWQDLIAPSRQARRAGSEQQRCAWEHGYCSRYASAGGYCLEHGHAPSEHYSERRGA